MDPERIDLAPLGLAADAARRRRLTAAILSRAEPELARRAAAGSPVAVLARWVRPMLAAAALLTVVSTALLLLTRREAEPPVATGVTDALEVPAPVNEWLATDRGPTRSDVLLALEGDEL